MVTGRVNGVRHSLVMLSLRGPDGLRQDVEALLDTGFSGELMLPSRIVHALALKQQDSVAMRIADGSLVNVPVYAAWLNWHGTERSINIIATGKQPLLGTALLEGSRLTMDFVVGGPITLEPMH